MSDDSNGGSIVDGVLTFIAIGFFLYLLFLSIPIAAYVDPILMYGFNEIKPESLFGKILTAFFFGLVPGFFLAKFLFKLTEIFFENETAQYIFLYAQGLFAISFIGTTENAFLSKMIVGIMAWGFKEDLQMGANIILGLSIFLVIVSIYVESNNKSTKRYKKYI